MPRRRKRGLQINFDKSFEPNVLRVCIYDTIIGSGFEESIMKYDRFKNILIFKRKYKKDIEDLLIDIFCIDKLFYK